MKKESVSGRKLVIFVSLACVLLILTMPMVSAGLLDWFKDLFGADGGGSYSISGRATSDSYLPPNETEELLVYHKFNSNDTITLIDTQGNYNGLRYGNPEFVSGAEGGAFSFDGNDCVYLEGSSGTSSDLNIYNKDLTISSWVKWTGYGNTIVTRAKPNYITYWLRIERDKACARVYSSPSHYGVCTEAILEEGNWYHIAGVFDRINNQAKVYVNGVLQASGYLPDAPYSNDGLTKIGCRNYDEDMPFTGTIDEVKIWNYALTGSEVSSEYNLIEPPVCIPNCAGKECGDDGCGGSCGACSVGYSCVNGDCIGEPAPSCGDGVCAGGTQELKIYNNETMTIYYQGTGYEVSAIVLDIDEARFIVNGEMSNILNSEETYIFSNGFYLYVSDINYLSYAGGNSSVDFVVGENEISCPEDCGGISHPRCGDGTCEGAAEKYLNNGEQITVTYGSMSYIIEVLVSGINEAKFTANGEQSTKLDVGDGYQFANGLLIHVLEIDYQEYANGTAAARFLVGENKISCPEDCGAGPMPRCGDGICEGAQENYLNVGEQIVVTYNNVQYIIEVMVTGPNEAKFIANGEQSTKLDVGDSYTFGNGLYIYVLDIDYQEFPGGLAAARFLIGENEISCPEDCGVSTPRCGDEVCEGAQEKYLNNGEQITVTYGSMSYILEVLVSGSNEAKFTANGEQSTKLDVGDGYQFANGLLIHVLDIDYQDFANGTAAARFLIGENEISCPEDCANVSICGNNVREGKEVCDGSDLGGQSCESLGFERGILGCSYNCGEFDVSNCYSGGDCEFLNATWSTTHAIPGDVVELLVYGENCHGKQVAFNIYEDDVILDDYIETIFGSFSGSIATVQWTVGDYSDFLGLSPEYFFKAVLVEDENVNIKSGLLREGTSPCVPSKSCSDYPGLCGSGLSNGCTNTLNCMYNCEAGENCVGGVCVSDERRYCGDGICEGAQEKYLNNGEQITVTYNNVQYILTVLVSGSNEVKFTANGEQSNKLDVGDGYQFANGLLIHVLDIDYQEYANGTAAARFLIGENKISCPEDCGGISHPRCGDGTCEGAVEKYLNNGEWAAVTYNNVLYNITVLVSASNEAKFTANGEQSTKLDVGDGYQFANGLFIHVLDIDYQEYAGGIAAARILVGENEISCPEDCGGISHPRCGDEVCEGAVEKYLNNGEQITVTYGSMSYIIEVLVSGINEAKFTANGEQSTKLDVGDGYQFANGLLIHVLDIDYQEYANGTAAARFLVGENEISCPEDCGPIDRTGPELNVSSYMLADSLGRLNIYAYDSDTYVDYIGIWYYAPGSSLLRGWQNMYYECDNLPVCSQEHIVNASDGLGTYRFMVKAYNGNDILGYPKYTNITLS